MNPVQCISLPMFLYKLESNQGLQPGVIKPSSVFIQLPTAWPRDLYGYPSFGDGSVARSALAGIWSL